MALQSIINEMYMKVENLYHTLNDTIEGLNNKLEDMSIWVETEELEQETIKMLDEIEHLVNQRDECEKLMDLLGDNFDLSNLLRDLSI